MSTAGSMLAEVAIAVVSCAMTLASMGPLVVPPASRRRADGNASMASATCAT